MSAMSALGRFLTYSWFLLLGLASYFVVVNSRPTPLFMSQHAAAENDSTRTVKAPWADVVIGISYLAIPLELAFFVVRLPSMTRYHLAVGVLFVCFILFCGVGHLLDAGGASLWLVAWDHYLTAFISGITACLSPIVFSYIARAAHKYKDDQELANKQRDMLADAQTMTKLGNWEIIYSNENMEGAASAHNDTDRLIQVSSTDLSLNASDEWFRLFGIDIPETNRHTIPFSRFMALVTEEDSQVIQQAVGNALEHGTPYDNVQHVCREDDGREIVIRSYGKPIFSKDHDKIVGLRGTAQDITSEVDITNELIRTREAALLESKHKDVFLATMSHELRTPLTSIIGHVELMEDTPLLEIQQEYIGNAKRAATTLLSLINDILDYSKLITGVVELEVRTVSINEILRDIHAIVKDLGRDIILKIDPYDGPLIIGDGVRIRQILLNLVSNAIKFTMPGGFVAVTHQHVTHEDKGGKQHEEFTFQVRDTGIGMSKSTVSKLFEPFRQADASTNRRFGGTGLGLSIVKRLVDAMNGRVLVESQEGVGTTFTVTLCFDRSPENESPPSTVKGSSKQNGEMLRILLAEDNHVTQRLVQRMLHEHYVDVADNGRIAVDMVKSKAAYDIMLCDVNMPIMDGLEATREIRQLERGKDVFIIGLTANAFKTDRDNCLQAGMDDYLSKPFSKQVLIEKVSNARNATTDVLNKAGSAGEATET